MTTIDYGFSAFFMKSSKPMHLHFSLSKTKMTASYFFRIVKKVYSKVSNVYSPTVLMDSA